MPPTEPSRKLRRRANRPALSRRQLRKGKLSPELLAAARSGILTKANTAKGTQGRQAVDRVKGYEPRARRTVPGETVRARLGHEVAVSRSISALLDDPPRFEVLHGVTRLDVKRIARYHEVTRQLVNRRSYRGKTMTPSASGTLSASGARCRRASDCCPTPMRSSHSSKPSGQRTALSSCTRSPDRE